MITASLIGVGSPRLVQLVVSATPVGESWSIVGTDGELVWSVPGGEGVGDGEQLTLVDNRAPLNVAVSYVLTSAAGSEESNSITRVSDSDTVLQSLDGQITVPVEWMDGSSALAWTLDQALFNVPGRPTPAVRYSPTSLGGGSWQFGIEAALTETLWKLFESGSPILFLTSEQVLDFPRSVVVQVTGLTAEGFTDIDYRVWEMPYVITADPYMDQRLGAFTWDYIDALQVDGSTVIRDGDEMEAIMSGLTWNEIDSFDWGVLE